MAAVLQRWWAKWGEQLLGVAIALLLLAGIHRLSNEFARLLWEPGRTGAIDLKLRYAEIQHWFASVPVSRPTYPPASYVLLWPFLGWMELPAARWFWALTTVPALAWLVYLAVRGSGAQTIPERLFVALMPVAMYATSATIGNGQLIVHLLPALVAGSLLLRRPRRGWGADVLAAALFLFALLKPTLAAPFCLLVLGVRGARRPVLLITLGYAAATLWAASFQEAGFVPLLAEWLTTSARAAEKAAFTGGYGNLHTWLTLLGWQAWNLPVALLVLGALGLWTYRHRHADVWLLLGVVALVDRLWTYHRLYDDLLLLLPFVSLFRIAKRGRAGRGASVAAGVLLAATCVAALAPARVLSYPAPWSTLFAAGQVVVWLGVLTFLLTQARRVRAPSQWETVRSAPRFLALVGAEAGTRGGGR
jgi:hypothetical protein